MLSKWRNEPFANLRPYTLIGKTGTGSSRGKAYLVIIHHTYPGIRQGRDSSLVEAAIPNCRGMDMLK